MNQVKTTDFSIHSMNSLQQIQAAHRASVALRSLTPKQIDNALLIAADALESAQPEILEANRLDCEAFKGSASLLDRLLLTPERLRGMAQDMRHVAELPSPLGQVLEERTLDNGLRLRRVSAPFGVIGVIYEARPNVTSDVFSLCLKAGSACVLKGGKDAECTSRTIARVLRQALRDSGLPEDACVLLPATHEAASDLLHARGLVDVVIPRGSRGLIDFVRTEASVPVIETGAGVCHTYFDRDGDVEIGQRCVLNGKTRRVSVCNALDCLLVHADRIDALPVITEGLSDKRVELYCDERSLEMMRRASYPAQLLHEAVDEDYGREFMDYKMAVRVVNSFDEAIEHIARYGSGHSESIITEDDDRAARFGLMVDAACVYHNAPTSFTDGAQFGLGAEIGISTQKLHARGPMGLREITTYKWLITGRGQIRP